MSTPIPQDRIQAINAAIFAGRKIEAIRLYRAATKIGLKEAKEFVEALEAQLRQESPELFTAPPAAGCARAAALLFALSASVIYALTRALIG
jgi:Ribosomal protein L7/L12 C-terminal domain